MSNVATKSDLKDAVRVLTLRSAAATGFMIVALGLIIVMN